MTNITKQVQPCLAEVRNQPDCVGNNKLEINQMLLIQNDLNYYFQISNLQRKYLTTILWLIYKNPQQQQQQQQKEIVVEENESLTPIQVKKIARLLKYGGCYCCCCCCCNSCICRQAQYTSTSSEYNAKKLYCKKLHLTTSSSFIRNTITTTTTITNTKRRTRRKRRRRRRRRRSRILSSNKKLLQMNAGKMHSSKTSTGKCSCPCQIQCSVVGYNNNTINGGSCSTCSCSWHIWHSSEKYKKQQQQHFLLLALNNNVGYGYRCRRFRCRYYMKNFIEYDDDINDVHVDDSDGIRKIVTSHACYQKLFHKNTTMLAPKCLNTTNTTTNTKMYRYNFLNVIAIATSTITTTITATRYIYIKYIFRKAFKQQQQEKEDEKTKVLLKEKKYVNNAGFQKTKIKELPIHANNVILYYKCKLLTSSSPTIIIIIIIIIEKEKEKTTTKLAQGEKLFLINNNNHHQRMLIIITSDKNSYYNNKIIINHQIANANNNIAIKVDHRMSKICCTWKFIAFLWSTLNKISKNDSSSTTTTLTTKTTTTLATIPQKSTIFIKSNTNNNNNNYKNNSYDLNKNQNIKLKNGQTDQKVCPEIERLNSQRDYDTSKYNREIFRFLTNSIENNKNNNNSEIQKQQNNNNNNSKQNHYTNCNNKYNNSNNRQTQKQQNNEYHTNIYNNNNNLSQQQQQQYNSLTCCTKQKKSSYRYSFSNYHKYNSGTTTTTTNLSFISILFLSFIYFATAHAQQFVTNALPAKDIGAPTSIAATAYPQVTLARNERVCRSLDIRNNPNDFRQLENCTVIEGFLLISLVNTHEQLEFNETYPLLREVSEFIIIYRIHKLKSLAKIFPNLAIIRGRSLFEGYALAIYSNPDLEEIGLSKLISISRGGVRIENNPQLCFIHTVHWELITNSTENVLRNNRNPLECPQCPGDYKLTTTDGASENELNCPKYSKTSRRHCWNSNNCQILCPDSCRDNCVDENTCCNSACIGGCTDTNPNVCTGCRNFSIDNNTCIDKCPATYFNYVDRRCITAETCAGIGTKYENNKPETLVAYDGNCTTQCPAGYAKAKFTCEECGDNCEKRCEGGIIDSVQHAKDMHGCTHIIKEGLTIGIKRGGRFLMEDLAYGLSGIKVIDTFLKVHLTYGIYSLEFFKNLKVIRGQQLYEKKFSLYVLENSDLEKIWGDNKTVRLENGRVFFHFNPKLCYSEILKLLPMMNNNATFQPSEVATDSNGSKGSCNPISLPVKVKQTTSHSSTVQITEPIKFEDERTFIGYIFYHIEDKFGNATRHGFRPCEDGWTSSDPTKDTIYIYQNLKPYTQYAFYVKTMTISMETRNAQSSIGHFKTKSHKPESVEWVRASARSSSEIVVSWAPPKVVNGKLEKYKLYAILNRISEESELETRNYCKNPLPVFAIYGESTDVVKQTTENPQNANCQCAPNEKSVSTYKDSETDTPAISEAMSFENAVQNFVYVKNPNSTTKPSEETSSRRRRSTVEQFLEKQSFLVRHMRAISNETLPNNGTLDVLINDNSTLIELSKNESKVVEQISRMDVNNTYYEVVYEFVNASTTQFIFSQLKHFSIYHVSVQACREPEIDAPANECSIEKEQQIRTLKLENVDMVRNPDAVLESTNNTRNAIRVTWEPPENPNGIVVSYTITFQSMSEDAVEDKRCVTAQDYRNLYQKGYVLQNLPVGNYSIRIRANTIAGDGLYAETKYVYIPPTRISNTVIAIIVLIILAFLTMVGGFLYYLRRKVLATPSDLKMFPSVNPYYISLQYIPDDWEVSRERVIQLSPLGQGSFGMVYEGIMKGLNDTDEDMPCAIKTVNENATDRERMNFLNEASVMKQFDTYHVVRLLGVCSRGQPALVIMELMKNGDLKSYLRAHRPDEREEGVNGYILPHQEQTPSLGGGTLFQPPPLSRIYQMAIEIADGMAYLSAKKFVHRDLAARNCMVAADLTVKIGDFGMTRDIYETDYYRKGTKGLLPVRWMPPESLRDGVYSSSSDIFSYGVVLWEMATLASQPYQGLSNDQVLRYVIDGGVMERPENCPDKLYSLMQRCWHHRPSARPTFMDIITFLSDMASPNFRQVSFYYSEEGEQIRQKELADKMVHSDDVFSDRDMEMDDVTTPLRVGEYNSSVENQEGNPLALEDETQIAAYSLGSDINASSTPEGHLRGGTSNMQSLTPKIQPMLEKMNSRSNYVPAYAPTTTTTNPIDIVIQKSLESDERGYEIYDPSPQSNLHNLHHDIADDANEDDDIQEGGGERLLPSKKLQPRIKSAGINLRQISNSMSDEVGTGMHISSSLHPSTASAASSNASSNATGKYPSLKKTVADTMYNVGHNLRNINKRLFSHKRTNSSSSQKSIQLQPTDNMKSSATTRTPTSVEMGGTAQLATIESGGSGSAGSYGVSPRFFTPAAASENPNYQPYDVNSSGANVNYQTTATTTNENPNYEIMQAPVLGQQTNSVILDTQNARISRNPNYQTMGPQAVNVDKPMMKKSNLDATTTIRQEDERETFLSGKTSSTCSSEGEGQGQGGGNNKDNNKKKHRKQQRSMKRMGGKQQKQQVVEDKKQISNTPLTITNISRNIDSTPTTTTTPDISTTGTTTTTGTAATSSNASLPSSRFSLKEKWLRQQAQQQQQQPYVQQQQHQPVQQSHLSPPPNGFIG